MTPHSEQPMTRDELDKAMRRLANVQRHCPTERDFEDLWHLVHVLFGVRIPCTRVCPGHSSPFEAFAHAFFARDPISVWWGSRGFAGKSFMLALLALTEQTVLGAQVNILGGSAVQSERVLGYMTGQRGARGKFWDAPGAPRWLLASDPTKARVRTINGGIIECLTASQKSVRGSHNARLRMDEIDEMDLDIFDAAMGQTMSDNEAGIKSQTVCSSTWQNPRGTMTEVLKRAKEHGWPLHIWCMQETMADPYGWLTVDEVRRKRVQVTKAMWNIEYELQEPNPEGRAIDGLAVEQMFDARLGIFDGRPGEDIRIIQPRRGLEFYHGTDWAKTKDWTILETFWKNTKAGQPDVLAAFKRDGRRPWPVMIGGHNARVKAYGGNSCHDSTGIGSVCHDFLEVPSQGFDFTAAKARADMLSSYISAIENGELRAPRIAWMHSEHKTATWDDIYGGKAGKGHLPDTIAAGALAHMARNLEVRREIFIGST